jgi:hypothetical protein
MTSSFEYSTLDPGVWKRPPSSLFRLVRVADLVPRYGGRKYGKACLAAGSPSENIDLDFASDFEMCASSVYTMKAFALSLSIPRESKFVEGGSS